MASTAELEAEILADLEENPDAYTAPINDVITIDPETKIINLPSSEVLFGTEEEQGVERKYFKCPRIVGDNIDLFTHQIYISYMAVKDKNATFIPDSIPQSYWCDDVALDETGNYITFSWLLSGNVLASRGFVGFAVIAKSVEGDILKTRWKTAPAVGTVLMTLPDAGEGIAELYPDIITQLLDRMGAMEEIATVEAMQGYVDDYLGRNPVQLDSTLTDPEKAAPANVVGELKSNLDTLNQGGLNLKEDFIGQQVNEWLDKHPEATTTVQDGVITEKKFSNEVFSEIYGTKSDVQRLKHRIVATTVKTYLDTKFKIGDKVRITAPSPKAGSTVKEQLHIGYVTEDGTEIGIFDSNDLNDAVDIVYTFTNNAVQLYTSTWNWNDIEVNVYSISEEYKNGLVPDVAYLKNTIVTPQMFGAKGDGVTDDTEALNRAIQSEFDTIYIPSGIYITSGSIFVPSNKTIYGDGRNSIIYNTVENGERKCAFIVGYFSSNGRYPSQNSVDGYRCTIERNKITLYDSTDVSNFSVGDIVFLCGNTFLEEGMYKAMFTSKICKISGNILELDHNIENDLLLSESTLYVKNFSNLHISTDNDDIGFIQDSNWCYETNTCHIVENVSISNLTIEMKYPETGSGMYGLFYNCYNCSFSNLYFRNNTTPLASNYGGWNRFFDIVAEYSGGISDLAEIQVCNTFDNINYYSKNIHPIHTNEGLTTGNGYGNIFMNVSINGYDGIGYVYAAYCPYNQYINCRFLNIYSPSQSNSAVVTSVHGSTIYDNCYIKTKGKGIYNLNRDSGAIIKNCTIISGLESILGNISEHLILISNYLSKFTETLPKGNVVCGVREVQYFYGSQLSISPSESLNTLSKMIGVTYEGYIEYITDIKFKNAKFTFNYGDLTKEITLKSDNTDKLLNIKFIRVCSGGIRMLVHLDNELVYDGNGFNDEIVSEKQLSINVSNLDTGYSVVITRQILKNI